MARKFSENINESVKLLLEKLINTETDASAYSDTMYKLGTELGLKIHSKLKEGQNVALASTAEDADNLSKGIIDILEEKGRKVLLTVFWNKRFKPNKENNITIAPIIKEFHEKGYKDSPTLIVTKSIIANSCVVRTNLTKLVLESNPSSIFVVAPVLLEGAKENLEREFESRIVDKFHYFYFAVDDKKSPDGTVIPGIGGDVYQRLGFSDQDAKNKFVPQIVKLRREVSSP